MAILTIELTNTIPSDRTYDVYIKKGGQVGDLNSGFVLYGSFSGSTYTISNPTPPLVYGEQYWIKIKDKSNNSFIVENIFIHDNTYFTTNCP